MTEDRWEQLRDIVCDALERPRQQRAVFVAEICGGDLELCAQAQHLLEQEADLGDFLGGAGTSGPLRSETSRIFAFAPGDLVAGRFEILEFLGEGGMGEVYRARDKVLDGKEVALKTVRADIAWDDRLHERLKHEVLLTRDIAHPNVCPVYDLAEGEGRSGPVQLLTMKLLEGETLAQRLERCGPMHPEEALSLARQMANGLTEAHRANVIHRDFKPGNVMLVDSAEGTRAVITDFGLARTVSLGDKSASGSGLIAGTLGYMAPEQLAGGRADKAVDVYSFGVVLHKMISGQLPQGGVVAGTVPRDWSRIIAHCLDPDPTQRYASPVDALADLERTAVLPHISRRQLGWAAVAAVLAGGLAGTWRLREHWFPVVPVQKHVTILPVDAPGDAISQEIGLGLQESMAGELERLEQFEKDYWVAPAKELRANRVHTASEAAKMLGANLAIQGLLTRTGPDYRFELSLVDARGKKLDSKIIVCPSALIYRLSEYAVNGAAELLRVKLGDEAKRLPLLAGTQNPDAHRLFEAARAEMNTPGIGNVGKAVEHLQQAVTLDGDYAQAHAALAEAYVMTYHETRQPDALDLARRNSRKALELNPRIAQSHYSAALVADRAGDIAVAEQEARRSLDMDGADVRALALLARLYSNQGRLGEAEQAYRRTIEIRPNYWNGYSLLGDFYYKQARYNEAERMFRTVLLISPRNVRAHYNLAGVLIATRRYDEAIGVLKESTGIQEDANTYTNLGYIYFVQKKYLQSAEAMRKAVELNSTNDVLWRNFGDACAKAPGREMEARPAYEKALELARRQLMTDERNPVVLTNLALYAAKLGDKTGAWRWLGLARRTNPADLNLRFKQAQILEITGRRDSALDVLRDLLAKGYSREQIVTSSELEQLAKDPRFLKLVGGKDH